MSDEYTGRTHFKCDMLLIGALIYIYTYLLFHLSTEVAFMFNKQSEMQVELRVGYMRVGFAV